MTEAKPDVFTDSYEEDTTSVAWGDVDGDGDLDLFVGNSGRPNRLYINEDGKLTEAKPDVFTDSYEEDTTSVAWGDEDGDGDLDLFVGNSGRPNRLYINEDGKLAEAKPDIFTDPYEDLTNSVAWGDMDGDGDLDLFAGNVGPNRLYINEDGKLTEAKPDVFTDPYEDLTNSVAWGDVDGDGDLDLFAGNTNPEIELSGRPNRLYLNDRGKANRRQTRRSSLTRTRIAPVAWRGGTWTATVTSISSPGTWPQPTVPEPGRPADRSRCKDPRRPIRGRYQLRGVGRCGRRRRPRFGRREFAPAQQGVPEQPPRSSARGWTIAGTHCDLFDLLCLTHCPAPG